MQGQENMYSGLKTRTAVLEHVRQSFVRSGVHRPTNPRVIVTLTLLKVGCNLWGYILSYRHLINRISRWLKQFKTQFKDQLLQKTARTGASPLAKFTSMPVVRGVYPEGFMVLPRKTSRLSGRGPSSFHSTLMYVTLL